MADQIKNITLKFSCPENWDSMTGAEGGRHCDKCNKTVYDFTDSKVEEFRAILAENNYKVCGHFTQNQILKVQISVWKKWVSAALVLIGFNFFFKKADAQTTKNKTHKLTHSEDLPINGLVLEPEASPTFPGGFKKFHEFISKTLNPDRVAGMKGRELISFMVEKNGTLSNFKVIQSINPKADKEIIRVLKLSPKWIPAKLNGKSVKAACSIPVVIQ